MQKLENISLILGYCGVFFVIISFICQLYQIYKAKNAQGTSWGLIGAQIISCILLVASAGINVNLVGIINLPFLVSNSSLLFLFLIMSYMKLTYDKSNNNNIHHNSINNNN